MRSFVIDKSTGEVSVVNKEKATILEELGKDGETDFFEVLTPEEYMNREIENAREAQIKEEHPTLSKLFPHTPRKMAKTGYEQFISKSGSDDLYTLPGRAIGATIDGFTGDGSFWKNWTKSLGQADANEQERNLVSNTIQGSLRDPMLIPGMALPVGRIPGFAQFTKGLAEKAGPAVGQRLVKPFLEGLASGTAVGVARPVVTDEEMRLLSDAIGGLGATIVFKNISKLLGRNLSKAEYDKLLMELANKNNVKAEFLDAAATPEERANIPKHYKTQSDIAEDLLDYKHFDETKFPEQKTVQEFLDRSQSKVTPDKSAAELTKYAEKIESEAGGGGLLTDEAASAARLKKEADIFYDPKSKEPAPVLFNLQGQQIKPSAPKPREMTAAQINNARQRIGKLLEDDFKREALGRTDGEVQTLKNVYFNLRSQLMDIAEKEGETAAFEAYKSMAGKLGARDALFDALRVPENRNIAQDRLTKNLENIEGNERKTGLREQLGNFDENFGTNFKERVKWMNISNALGESTDGSTFKQLRGDNNYFTGKGVRKPFTDNLTGRTVASAVKKLEKAKQPETGGIFLGSNSDLEKMKENARQVASMYGPEDSEKYNQVYWTHLRAAIASKSPWSQFTKKF